MFKFVSVFLVVAIAIAGYFFLSPQSPLNPSVQLTPANTDQITNQPSSSPNNSISNETNSNETIPSSQNGKANNPLKLAALTPLETKQAKAHVDSITAKAQIPIAIKTADHFVTADQILELPELNRPNIVKVESSIQTIAVVVSATTQENANLNTVDTNANNAQAAQSFAIKMPSFKKSTINASDKQAAVIKIEAPDETKAITTNNGTKKILEAVTESVPIVSPANTTQSTSVQVSPKSKPILAALKNNIIELSDIKVEDLAQIVADTSTPDNQATTLYVKTIPATKQVDTQEKNAVSSTLNNTTSLTTELLVKPSTQSSVTPPTIQASAKSQRNMIKLRELLSETQSDKKRIFYLHAVNVSDEQGIWGIIQQGLMGTFSKGIALSQASGTLQALIPLDADEKLSSKQSSFLGKLLNYKVLTTYVYNYEQGNIGTNPDYIKPGQQLIIVTFTEQELMSVYQHFKKQQEL